MGQDPEEDLSCSEHICIEQVSSNHVPFAVCTRVCVCVCLSVCVWVRVYVCVSEWVYGE